MGEEREGGKEDEGGKEREWELDSRRLFLVDSLRKRRDAVWVCPYSIPQSLAKTCLLEKPS